MVQLSIFKQEKLIIYIAVQYMSSDTYKLHCRSTMYNSLILMTVMWVVSARPYTITNLDTIHVAHGKILEGFSNGSVLMYGQSEWLVNCVPTLGSTAQFAIVDTVCQYMDYNYSGYDVIIVNTYVYFPLFGERIDMRVLALHLDSNNFSNASLKINVTYIEQQYRPMTLTEKIIIGVATGVFVFLFFCCGFYAYTGGCDRRIHRFGIALNISTGEYNNTKKMYSGTSKDIKSLWHDYNSDIDNCAICIESMDDNMIKKKTKCGHVFHEDCIQPWLREHKECPLCKTDLKEIIIVKTQNAVNAEEENNNHIEENEDDGDGEHNNENPNGTIVIDPDNEIIHLMDVYNNDNGNYPIEVMQLSQLIAGVSFNEAVAVLRNDPRYYFENAGALTEVAAEEDGSHPSRFMVTHFDI
jgi:hypothetical protein